MADANRLPITRGTVHGAAAIEKLRKTSGARLKFASPDCEAVTAHEPAPLKWILVPVTVHFPLAAKETARPEDAVALTLKSGAP